MIRWWTRTRGSWQLPEGRDWLWGNPGLALTCWTLLDKPLVQFSVDGQGCVPSQKLGLRPKYVEGVKAMMETSPRGPRPALLYSVTLTPQRPLQTTPPPRTAGHSQEVCLGLLWGHCSFLLARTCFGSCPPESASPGPWKFCNQTPLASKIKFPGGSQSLRWVPRLANPLCVLELS